MTKLLLSADHYASISPAVARFYALEAERLKKKLYLPESTASQMCPYCRTIRRPDNCTRRLRSKMHTNRQIGRVERKRPDGRTVGKFARSVLALRSAGANRMQIRCRSCRRRIFVRGAGRPAKVSKASDLTPRSNSHVEVRNEKSRKRKRNRTADSDTKAANFLSAGRDTDKKSLEKCRNQMPVHPECSMKRKVTNKKEMSKQKHNMLQNILKRKKNTASSDTSVVLKSFLMSL